MKIPYGKQDIQAKDVQAVIDVLNSDFLTQGPLVPRFEHAFSGVCEAPYAVATNSATSALHLACLALDLQPGGLVWTSPITFLASANCALYCSASVDFIDIDQTTGLISITALKQKLKQAKKNNRLPDIIIPVHLAGQSCDMQAIKELVAPLGIAVIEDASHAVGATYQELPVGACQYSDICVFSFHPVKIITSGEGGMATTKRFDLAQRMSTLRSHGVIRDKSKWQDTSQGDWYYEQQALGFNYRMTDIHAALGLSQLNRLSQIISQRNQLAKAYQAALEDLPVTLLNQNANQQSAWHLLIIQLDKSIVDQRRIIFNELRALGIGVNVHYIPVHTQPFYQQLGFAADDFPQAIAYYQGCLSLPLFPGLKTEEFDYIIASLKKALLIGR